MTSEILVIGLSHHTAPVEIREKLSVATEAMTSRVAALLRMLPIDEAMLLSTCNRVELWSAAADIESASRALRAYLAEHAAPDQLDNFLYEKAGRDAVSHAFRMTSSLDSMVVGEPQILGQVKGAFGISEGAHATGPLLSSCFQRAFSVAKRVRRETGIAAGTVSISSIAVELAQQIFGSLDGRRVLLLGAGKMSESAARNLGKRGARLFVVNRSREKAKALAVSCGGSPRPLEHLEEELRDADVVISSTSSPDYVIGADLMKRVVKARKRRPLFLIDIAVPRDIDPAIADLDNVFLYDVDDLSQVAADNLAARRREADAAERIVAEEVAAFESWRASLDLKPTIVSLRAHFQTVAQEELARLAEKTGLAPDEREKLEAMAHRLINRLLHQPLTELKKGQSPGETMRLVAAVHQLFQLEGPKGDKEST